MILCCIEMTKSLKAADILHLNWYPKRRHPTSEILQRLEQNLIDYIIIPDTKTKKYAKEVKKLVAFVFWW